MIRRKSTFFLGIFIFLIPFLGLPSFWKVMLTALSGLALIALSTKLGTQKKPIRKLNKKEKTMPVEVPIIQPDILPKEPEIIAPIELPKSESGI